MAPIMAAVDYDAEARLALIIEAEVEMARAKAVEEEDAMTKGVAAAEEEEVVATEEEGDDADEEVNDVPPTAHRHEPIDDSPSDKPTDDPP
jgi:hypothetical protein